MINKKADSTLKSVAENRGSIPQSSTIYIRDYYHTYLQLHAGKSRCTRCGYKTSLWWYKDKVYGDSIIDDEGRNRKQGLQKLCSSCVHNDKDLVNIIMHYLKHEYECGNFGRKS